MSSEGWVKVHRRIQDNPLWTCEKFTRGQAWVDLIILANHTDSFFYKRGVKIDVKRGECARSVVELADRWQWSRTKVNKFLNDLKKEQQIDFKKTNITQLLTILNYDEYQQREQQTGQQKSSRRAAEKHIQECKEGKECKEVKIKAPVFSVSSYRPDWIPEQDWKDIILHRKKHPRKPPETERAYKGIIKQLSLAVSQGHSLEKCLDKWVSAGWSSFDASWMNNGNGFSKKQEQKTFAQMKDENMRNAMKDFVEDN